ncbi:MAG: M3 family metallopeptidase [Desulfobacteraceae bacterium]|jgi:thimet oligopeptidase
MKKMILLLLIILLSIAACGKEDSKPLIYSKYSTPDIDFYTDSENLAKNFESEFNEIKDTFDKIDAIPYEDRTVQNTLYRMDEQFARLDFPNTFLLAYVSTDKDIREAALKCEEEVSKYLSSFLLREKTYKALKDLQKKYQGEFLPDEKRFLDDTIRDFELEGIQLDKEKKEKLKEINSRISMLSIEFSKNIRDDKSSITLPGEDLKGLPPTVLERLEKDNEGKYTLKTDYPTYFSIMKYADSSDVRKNYSEVFKNRGYPVNIPLLKEILTLKKEKATILGYPAIRDLLLINKMAKTPEAVNSFLTNLVSVISGKAAEDRNTLKKANNGNDVNIWDVNYLENKIIREKFNVDEEKVREYFSLESTIKGCMKIYEDLFSIKFEEKQPQGLWHPDVKKYNVISEGKVIAGIYLDLFPRENKYSHAAQFGLRKGRLISGDYYESPVVALVCNFAKPTKDKPSLLSLDEVETFFHEFGHGMHSCLTTARLGVQSGTSVKRDFVECPSQMFELWMEKPEILSRFARHYKTGEPMPEKLIDNIVKLNYFLKAHTTTRQAFYALFDQAIHGPEVPESTTELWAKMMWDITKYKYQPNTHFEAAFDHLVSGYSAGYYSYLWSEVISVDMFSRFKEEGLMNPKLGMEYRVKVLSKGDSKDPVELVIDFLGRKSNSDAFLQILQKDI